MTPLHSKGPLPNPSQHLRHSEPGSTCLCAPHPHHWLTHVQQFEAISLHLSATCSYPGSMHGIFLYLFPRICLDISHGWMSYLTPLSYSDDTDDFLIPVRLSPTNPLLGITSVPLATQPLTLPCVTCHHRHPRDCDTVSPCRLGSSRGTPLGTISRLINTIWSFRANWRSLLTRELLECKQRDDGDRLNCWTADEA